ncbi:MAG: hypothetical protein ACRDUV_11640 [Pseudonocardiaceae bacterium]
MSLGGRLSAAGRRTIRERLVAEVGGYLRNVVREPHVTCAVCATPIKPAFDLCLRCWRDQQEFGADLADLVVCVCYAIRGRQSGYLMHSYKDLEAPARHNQTLLSVLLLAALDLTEGASSTDWATTSTPGRSCRPFGPTGPVSIRCMWWRSGRGWRYPRSSS